MASGDESDAVVLPAASPVEARWAAAKAAPELD